MDDFHSSYYLIDAIFSTCKTMTRLNGIFTLFLESIHKFGISALNLYIICVLHTARATTKKCF